MGLKHRHVLFVYRCSFGGESDVSSFKFSSSFLGALFCSKGARDGQTKITGVVYPGVGMQPGMFLLGAVPFCRWSSLRRLGAGQDPRV